MVTTKGPSMSDVSSHSRMRIALAQFCIARGIDFETLYAALGIDMTAADSEALSHMAGVMDGMTAAVEGIRQNGIDEWTKGR